MKKLGVFSLGIVLVGVLLSGIPQAAPVSRTGPIRKFSGVDEIVQECTTSTSFTSIPSMTRTFTLGGSTNASVAVIFQGAFSLSGSSFDTGFLQLQIDGVSQSPGEIPVISEGELTATHGFNWQSRRLAPGSHTVRMQWRTDLGSSFCVDARSLLILHR